MDFSRYQGLARTTAIYPNIGSNPYYPTLGLVGQAGEIANKVKKIMRDYDGVITPDMKTSVSKEIADLVWDCAAHASEFGLSLNPLAEENIAKLASRKERGVITGSGDER